MDTSAFTNVVGKVMGIQLELPEPTSVAEPDLGEKLRQSIYSRFVIKDKYDNEDDILGRKGPAPINLFGKFVEAYKAFFYMSYLSDFLKSVYWDCAWNTFPNDTEKKINKPIIMTTKNGKAEVASPKDGLIQALADGIEKLRSSLEWLESIQFPKSLQSYSILPFTLDGYEKKTMTQKSEFLEKLGIRTDVEAEKFKFKTDIDPVGELPSEFIKTIWNVIRG